MRRDDRGKERGLGWRVAGVVGHGGYYTGKMARKTPKQKKSQQRLKAARKGEAARLKGRKAQAKADAKAAHGELPQWTKAEIEEAFRRFAAANPAPRGELQHINPFTLLVAVVLSAQAADAGSVRARRYAGADGKARRSESARSDQDHRPLSHQSEERDRAVAAAL